MHWLKLIAPALQVLRRGQELRHAAAWKNAQVIASALGALVVFLRVAGIDLGISDADLLELAGGIVALINIYVVVASSAKVGFSPTPHPDLPPIAQMDRPDTDADMDATGGVRSDAVRPENRYPTGQDHDNGDGWNG
ncbi:MAG: hypothetical protein IAF00_01485 [Phycisphaerales bacterium]|nr:hypothetical protein [Phycisphaerales bacterium]